MEQSVDKCSKVQQSEPKSAAKRSQVQQSGPNCINLQQSAENLSQANCSKNQESSPKKHKVQQRPFVDVIDVPRLSASIYFLAKYSTTYSQIFLKNIDVCSSQNILGNSMVDCECFFFF